MSLPSQNILALSPHFYFRGEQQSGNVIDLGSVGATCTPQGTTNKPTYGTRNFASQRGNLAVRFVKVSDSDCPYFDCGTVAGDFEHTQAFTIVGEIWFDPATVSGADALRVVVSKRVKDQTGWSVSAKTGGTLTFTMKNNNSGHTLNSHGSTTLLANRRYQFKITYSGVVTDTASVTMEVCGAAETMTVTTTMTAGDTIKNAAHLCIGSMGGQNYGFHGWIDEVAIFTSVLSAPNLATLNTAAPMNSPVVAGGTLFDPFNGACEVTPGTIFVPYRKGTSHGTDKGVIVGRISTDNGVTWGSEINVASDATYDCRDPHAALLADGRIAVSYFIYNYTIPAALTHALRVVYSSDGGHTWTSPQVITDTFTTYSSCCGAMRQDANGKLYQPAYGQNTGDTTIRSVLIKSSDNGVTWGSQTAVAGTGSDKSYSETCIGTLDDGTALALVRNETDATLDAYLATTLDGTWTRSTTNSGVVATGSDSPTWIQIPVKLGAVNRIYMHARSATGVLTTWYNDDRLATVFTGAATYGSTNTSGHGDWVWNNSSKHLILISNLGGVAGLGIWAQTIGDFLTSPVTVDPSGAGDFKDRLTAYNQIANEYGTFTINRYAGDATPANASVTLGANISAVTDQCYDPSVQHKNVFPDSLTGYAYDSHDLTITTTKLGCVLTIDGTLHQGKLTVIPAGPFVLTNHLNQGANAGVKVDGSAAGGGATVQDWSAVSINVLAGGSQPAGLEITGSVQIQGNIDHVTVLLNG